MSKSEIIRDYSVYTMSQREKILFFSGGFACIAFVVYLFYHSFIAALIAGAAVFKLTPLYCSLMVQRRMNTLDIQFRDLLTSLSASVSAGRHMSEAICEAPENLSLMYDSDDLIMIELEHMRRSICENNESDKVLLMDFARRTGSEDINNFVQVYTTCRSLGGDTEKIIARTSEILTDKMNIEREIKAITAQKKLEGRIISLMPLAMLLVLNLVSPAYISPLYSTMMGRLLMTGCLMASVYGIRLMERIVAVDL